jgi:hypothetical protein
LCVISVRVQINSLVKSGESTFIVATCNKHVTICLEKVIRDSELETRDTIFNKSIQILAYVDDMVLIGCSLAVKKLLFV